MLEVSLHSDTSEVGHFAHIKRIIGGFTTEIRQP